LSSGGSSCGHKTGTEGGSRSRLRHKVLKKKKLVISDDQLHVAPTRCVEEIKEKFFGDVKTSSAPNLTALNNSAERESKSELTRNSETGKSSEFLGVQAEVSWANDVCCMEDTTKMADMIEQSPALKPVAVLQKSMTETVMDDGLTFEVLEEEDTSTTRTEPMSQAVQDSTVDTETDSSSDDFSESPTAEPEVLDVQDHDDDPDGNISCCEATESPDSSSAENSISKESSSPMNLTNVREGLVSALVSDDILDADDILDTVVETNVSNVSEDPSSAEGIAEYVAHAQSEFCTSPQSPSVDFYLRSVIPAKTPDSYDPLNSSKTISNSDYEFPVVRTLDDVISPLTCSTLLGTDGTNENRGDGVVGQEAVVRPSTLSLPDPSGSEFPYSTPSRSPSRQSSNRLPVSVTYPSAELLSRLTACSVERPFFPYALSPSMSGLSTMSGLEVVNFFHSGIALISTDCEELIHILWTSVVMYSAPMHEVPACVMLSNKAIYFVSDVDVREYKSAGKLVRRRSETCLVNVSPQDVNHFLRPRVESGADTASRAESDRASTKDSDRRSPIKNEQSGFYETNERRAATILPRGGRTPKNTPDLTVGLQTVHMGSDNSPVASASGLKLIKTIRISSRRPSSGSLSAFEIISLADLQLVNVSLFSQCLRLLTSNQRVLSCITRNAHLTEDFIHHLGSTLSSQFMKSPSPARETLKDDDELDIYKQFNSYNCMESKDGDVWSTKVCFHYPQDDAITDLTYLLRVSIASGCQKSLSNVDNTGQLSRKVPTQLLSTTVVSDIEQVNCNILLYLLAFAFEETSVGKLPSIDINPTANSRDVNSRSSSNSFQHEPGSASSDSSQSKGRKYSYNEFHVAAGGFDLSNSKPQSLILTEEYLCLAVEDHVSYPLPEFTRILPDNLRTKVMLVRSLDCLRCVTLLRSSCANVVVFTFMDESNEIVVDANVDYYSVSDKRSNVLTSCPETKWNVWIRNVRDRDRLVDLVSKQWSELHDNARLDIEVL